MHYGILLMGIVVALRRPGIRLDALFTAGAVFAVGFGFGFAMQNITQNFVCGVITIAFPQVDVPIDQPVAESLRLLSGSKASSAA